MYKLIAIDIDGTLLNSKGELTKRTRDVIKRATSSGIEVVLTSGRVSDVVKNIAKDIGADKYLIAENGASIIDLRSDEIIYKNYIRKQIALDILDVCLENNIYYMIYTTKELIIKDLKHMALYFYKQNYNYNPASGMETHLAGREYIETLQDDITKMMICDEDRAVYNSIVNKLSKYADIDVTAMPHVSNKVLTFGTETKELTYSYADISAKNTNKWEAIKILAAKLSINQSEIVAIGDNINDLPMIENAGLGVAMQNGSPVAIASAKIVTKTNDQDGVAEVIESIL